MLKVRSNHNRVVARWAVLVASSLATLFGLPASAQVSELKIVDLEGDQIIRIDSAGSVFNGTDRKVAVINDSEGSVTFVRPHDDTQKLGFKNDPAIKRDGDRYTVNFAGETYVFDVKPEGAVSYQRQPWARI